LLAKGFRVARDIQLNIRLDSTERERLTRLGTYHGKTDGEMLRHLIWAANVALISGAPPIVPPDHYPCGRLKITPDELQILISARYLAEPPTREEVDEWLADETRRTPRSVLTSLAKRRATGP
jgi:hypothetical protein